MPTLERCSWANAHPLLCEYHDTEWGVPLYEEKKLFEFIVLGSFQAGLSWLTILKKRSAFRKAFCDFQPKLLASFTLKDQERLQQDASIIRNRLKIKAALQNAEAFLEIQETYGSFASYLWDFVQGSPHQNHWQSISQIPASSPLSDQVSKALKKKGFRFVGSTISYAFLQGVGVVNDHLVSCFRYPEVQKLARPVPPPQS
jgi:DNA-3-methyladenine glycosylase I